MNIFRFCCLCTFIALCSWSSVTFAQIVEIPDPKLERAIRQELGLSSGVSVTQQDMLQLDTLTAEDAQIENLTGLEYAHNLEGLHMRNNPVSDLTPIAGLSRLESLELSRIPIEDLTFLKDLTQLRQLHLFACQITDITPIQNLTKLVFLNLGANRITDLKPISNLTALETLWLQNNYIVDISPLANLAQLKELKLVDNQIKNVGALANLTGLERLAINANPILDFSPIQGLSLVDFRYDEVCLLDDLPIQERIENRDFPSIFQPWDNGIGDLWDDLPGLSHLSYEDRIAYHDIFWHGVSNPFELEFQKYPPWSQLSGPIEVAVAERDKLLAKNPNMLFLAHVVSTYTAPGGQFPEDWFGWVRDEGGNPVNARPTTYLIDYRRPDVQDVLVQQAVSVAQCGIFDGILYDTWGNGTYLKLHNRSLPYPDYDEETHAKLLQEEVEARTTILKRIRENVPDDFLILVNNFRKSPFSIPYINGGWMETNYDGWEDCLSDCGYTRRRIAEIEANLIWYEENAREPQITCLRALGIPTEPPDSPNNRRWMRLFTTMSLTLSDGYALYTIGGYTAEGHKQYQNHIWYDFWDANLGQPISPTAQHYQGIPSLYIREFTNGWAVYNRSGQAQTITLPASATPVSDRDNNDASITHLLPDLDGEIYLATRSFADVNGDGAVNVLDLVQVANGFGKSAPDPNGDGVVNILDLVFVAQQFSQ